MLLNRDLKAKLFLGVFLVMLLHSLVPHVHFHDADREQHEHQHSHNHHELHDNHQHESVLDHLLCDISKLHYCHQEVDLDVANHKDVKVKGVVFLCD